MDISLIEKLEKRLREPLPGMEAQKIMSPVHARSYHPVEDGYKVACVVLLLFPKNDAWNICFIRRTSHNPNDRHAGQISFPGGKLEETDESLEHCALREAHEEIGVPPHKIGIIGQMSELYVYVSNFLVYPFIGFMEERSAFKMQESEVQEIIEIPIEVLNKQEMLKSGEIIVRNNTLQDVPYFDLNGQKLWGATAMMTSEFLHIYRDLQLQA